VAFSEADTAYMRKALELAALGRGSVEPNPMVGAVIVRDGRIVGQGYHQRFGGPHAEVLALEQAGELARGATMYVTLEPCAHYGKTPPCAPRVADAGIVRVVTCSLDPMQKTQGKGLLMLQERGVTTEVALLRDDALRLNAGFFKLASVGRPLLTAKWAMSADGRIATYTGDSRWISSPASRLRVHQVRAVVDCIVVGGRTAVRDDPLLTCRQCEPKRTAARLVICSTSAPAPDSQLAKTVGQAPVILAYPQGHPPPGLRCLQDAGCEAVPIRPAEGLPDRVDLGALLDLLGRRQMTSILLEGGADMLGGFFDAGLVDRVMIFVAPVIIGGARATAAVAGQGARTVGESVRLRDMTVSSVGPDTLLEAWVSNPLAWAP